MTQLTRASIAAHPLFPSIEKQIARHLIGIHNKSPRLSRLKASQRKWLMTHSLFALALSRNEADPLSGLTATRFIDTVMRLGAASRNTATAYLAELVAYKFLRDVPDLPDKRVRVLELTETSMAGMTSWFHGHMACLDRLDGGGREATAIADPRIFRLAQPIAAEILLEDPHWRNPSEGIGHFLWSDYGGMILHDLISRLGDFERYAPRVLLGTVSLPQLSETYLTSATNLKRMFSKAEADDLLGWELPRRRGALWLSGRFIEDYFTWQSAKFAALDLAYCESLRRLDGDWQATAA